MFTPCTGPAAPFYHLDLAILDLFARAGIDAPCEFFAIVTLLTIAAGFTLLALAVLGAVSLVRGALI